MTETCYTLITGASQGFGKALALECARRKMNLVLVALPGEGLPELSQYIKARYAVDCIAIEKDLSVTDHCTAVYRQVIALDVKVNVLINNAGVGSTELFRDGSLAAYQNQIRLNVLATTTLTYLFLDLLAQNRPAYILNVGSLAAFFSLQKKQVYGATKSFICYFSKSLRRELRKQQIHVSVVCPGGMHTNQECIKTIQTGDRLSRASGMLPEAVAPIALDGLLRKKEVIVPGKINSALYHLNRMLPRFIVRFFEERTMKRIHTPPDLTGGKKQVLVPLYAPVTPGDDVFVSSK